MDSAACMPCMRHSLAPSARHTAEQSTLHHLIRSSKVELSPAAYIGARHSSDPPSPLDSATVQPYQNLHPEPSLRHAGPHPPVHRIKMVSVSLALALAAAAPLLANAHLSQEDGTLRTVKVTRPGEDITATDSIPGGQLLRGGSRDLTVVRPSLFHRSSLCGRLGPCVPHASIAYVLHWIPNPVRLLRDGEPAASQHAFPCA